MWVGGGEAGWQGSAASRFCTWYSVLRTAPSFPFLRHPHLHVCARNVSRGGDGDRPCGSPALFTACVPMCRSVRREEMVGGGMAWEPPTLMLVRDEGGVRSATPPGPASGKGIGVAKPLGGARTSGVWEGLPGPRRGSTRIRRGAACPETGIHSEAGIRIEVGPLAGAVGADGPTQGWTSAFNGCHTAGGAVWRVCGLAFLASRSLPNCVVNHSVVDFDWETAI